MTLVSDDSVVWNGRVSSVDFKAKEQGNTDFVTLVGYSVDDQLSRGQAIADGNRLVAESVGRGVTLEGIANDPQGLGVSDDFILVLDADNKLS